MNRAVWIVVSCVGWLFASTGEASEIVLLGDECLLRNAEPREWANFPELVSGQDWSAEFIVDDAFRPRTLRLRHRDLKQLWRVQLDETEVARLPRDENAMVTFWSLPPEKLTPGKHRLRIHSSDKQADDVAIGDVRLDDRPPEAIVAEAQLELQVVDARGAPTPARVTVVDARGALMTTSATSNETLAVRAGVIYTATGQVRCGVPQGKYTIYAGRGFEYSRARLDLVLQPGQRHTAKLVIERVVPTAGWVACDPHVHTLTFSGHGDATIAERMITLAGEGIELPIATDHNVQIDYETYAQQLGVRKFFTPVTGNEVTTKVGHFNVFPLPAGAPPLDHRGTDWQQVRQALRGAGNEAVVILNHARDIHSGFRPFDPTRHLAVAGEDRLGWQLPANAMEVINSGATQSEPWQLFHDWLGLLNRGLSITPIGSSDSHDVAKHFVGQGRTYVQVDDRDPGQIDQAAAIRNLRSGRVMVGSGLLCQATINGRYGPGDLAPQSAEYEALVEVLAPDWVAIPEVRLYRNGIALGAPLQTTPPDSLPMGVRWRGTWRITDLKQDAHLVAVAVGPGVTELFWPTAKPYQPSSTDPSTHCVGCCGAIRIDGDGDGRYTSPFEYARQVVERSGTDLERLIDHLAVHDQAVATEAASTVLAQGTHRMTELVRLAGNRAEPQVRRGILAYYTAWRAALPPAVK